jgi:ribosomal protein S18 acetylase RimI-like enzyme
MGIVGRAGHTMPHMPSDTGSTIRCLPADLSRESHRRAVADLVNMYAREPLARGSDLPPAILERLPEFLHRFPTARVFLARRDSGDEDDGSAYLAVAVCVLSISTFAAAPVMNIHDIAVRPGFRGRGVGTALLAEVERAAREMRCCKITLEVHRENAGAIAAYRAAGFADGAAAPDPGEIWFFEKRL